MLDNVLIIKLGGALIENDEALTALYEGLKRDKNDVSHDTFKSDVFSLGFCFLKS